MHRLKKLITAGISAAVIFTGAIYAIQVKNVNIFDIPSGSVSAASNVSVIPGGNPIGIKLYTRGLLVVDTASFESASGDIICPCADGGIMSGDIILSINGTEIESSEMFIDKINSSADNTVTLSIMRKGDVFETSVTPAEASDRKYKIGTWVRDSAAGIGTLTFYRCDNGTFAALGHGISDIDVNQQYIVKNGSIEAAEISSVVKGAKGAPGELKGVFTGSEGIIGTVAENGLTGIYGRLNTQPAGESVKVASRWEVKEGFAEIICTTGSVPERYDIEIQRIILGSAGTSKSMVIKITDKSLIEKTGGIVRGMSGAPIVQNGKLAERLVGVRSQDELEDMIEKYL